MPRNCAMLNFLFVHDPVVLSMHSSNEGKTLLKFNDYLALSLKLNCSDPHDFVYGLLGIYESAHKGLDRLLQPDYSKPLGHVFRDATRYAFQDSGLLWHGISTNHRSLEVLLARGTPSWAMEWQKPVDRHQRNIISPFYNAGGIDRSDDRGQRRAGHDNDLLLVHGFTLGRVESARTTLLDDTASSDASLNGWIKHVSDVTRTILSEREHLQKLSRTLVAGRDPSGFPVSTSLEDREATLMSDLDCDNNITLDHTVDGQPSISQVGKPNELKRETMQFNSFVSTCLHQRVFTCDSHMGVGPQLTQGDDIIALIAGSKMPVVLRHAGSRTSAVHRLDEPISPRADDASYRLLGQCYIEDDDIMTGRAMEKYIADANDLEEFILR